MTFRKKEVIMKNRLIDMGGNLIMVLGVMAFAYTIASPFVAPLWVSAILIVVTILLLALAFKLWDIAEGRMTIEEAKKFIGQVDESYGVLGDSDIYNAVSLVDELDGLTTEENRLYDHINDIDTKIYETESKIIELAEKLEEKYV